MAEVQLKMSSVAQRKDVNFSKKATNSVVCELFSNVRKCSLNGVKSNLIALKKLNGNVDARNPLGNTALHLAVWRNHIPIIRLLLEFGANPDARDSESGWSSLHRAFHFGHFVAASVLISNGASLNIEDFKQRTPIDLISCFTSKAASSERFNEVYSWGNGSNYQLGMGTAGILKLPTRIESLQGQDVVSIASARFHNVAITSKGSILSWGFGRGGRLGHSDFDIHSGQVAVIFPQLVSFGSGITKFVKCIAVAKHHTIISTVSGEVYSWGNNREGRLGYNSVDTQATPRRVSSLRMRVANVAASNKHSVAITENGEVWTFGCNRDGQLGYGTSNSSSNSIPRIVEFFRGRRVISASASKCHTLVLSSEGEVFSWGHRMVTPRKVNISRETQKFRNSVIKFHKQDRFRISCIAAGYMHSTALSDDGSVFFWPSNDLNLKAKQIPLQGQEAVSVSAGKYHTAIVTKTGDAFSWEGTKGNESSVPIPQRISGLKHTCSIGVGENHFIAVVNLHVPVYPTISSSFPLFSSEKDDKDMERERDREDAEEDTEEVDRSLDMEDKHNPLTHENLSEFPSLKDLCQEVIGLHIVEPRNAVQLLEIADSLQSPILKSHCEEMVNLNLDYILTTVPQQLISCSLDVLADYESKVLSRKMKSTNPNLPSPTASWNVVLESTEEGKFEFLFEPKIRKCYSSPSLSNSDSHSSLTGSIGSLNERKNSFIEDTEDEFQSISKQLRVVKKKLQQIEVLESKLRKKQALDAQQMQKLKCKKELETCLKLLEAGVLPPPDIFDSLSKENDSDKHWNEPGKSEGKKKKKKDKRENIPMSDTDRNSNEKEKGEIKLNMDMETMVTNVPNTSSISTDFLSSLVREPDELESRKFESSVVASQEGQFIVKTLSADPTAIKPLDTKKSAEKKKARKGGLSQFLNGELEKKEEEKILEKIVIVKSIDPSSPAWGGIKPLSSPFPSSSSTTTRPFPVPFTSLREIQSQQNVETMTSVHTPVRKASISVSPSPRKDSKSEGFGTNRRDDKFNEEQRGLGHIRAPINIPISQLVQRNSQVDVVSRKNCSSEGSLPKASPPAWSMKPNSGSMEKASFKDIQMQQEEYKTKLHNFRQQASNRVASPSSGTLTSSPIIGGFDTKEHGTSSTFSPSSASPVTNRWYRPDEPLHTSLRNIQIEESAMQELRQKYGNVRLVHPFPSK